MKKKTTEKKDTCFLPVILSLIAILIAVIAISGVLSPQKVAQLGASASWNMFSGGATNASTSVATSSTAILARNVNRQYAIVCNNDGTNYANLNFHASAATIDIASTAAVVVTTVEK